MDSRGLFKRVTVTRLAGLPDANTDCNQSDDVR